MVNLTRIYTKGGDKGETSLGDGTRVAKHDLRIETIGAVDEANCAIGLARLHTGDTADLDEVLAAAQNDLFDIGGDLSVPAGDGDATKSRLRVTSAQVERLEAVIDALNENLAPLKSFVLPGGSPAAAHLHLARALVRRAERLAASLATRDGLNPVIGQYLNRLSDFLFVAARAANDAKRTGGTGDVLWVPGKTQGK
ncbi:MAG: cob(I)yrinic acid a,c-diamide adenosyltransferase [Alphaproteobacteria bacterium]|nr:cob(I)yrinic acid a,c-diamide adenosyltransferase [Alphaproteobacteria bacterium]